MRSRAECTVWHFTFTVCQDMLTAALSSYGRFRCLLQNFHWLCSASTFCPLALFSELPHLFWSGASSSLVATGFFFFLWSSRVLFLVTGAVCTYFFSVLADVTRAITLNSVERWFPSLGFLFHKPRTSWLFYLLLLACFLLACSESRPDAVFHPGRSMSWELLFQLHDDIHLSNNQCHHLQHHFHHALSCQQSRRIYLTR